MMGGAASEVIGYSEARATLSSTTQIPLRLPSFIPFAGDANHPVFSILEEKESKSYAVQLAWAKECTGGNWCHLGSIRGSAAPMVVEGKRIPIHLHKSIRGFFVPARCFAYCTEATIIWSEGGNYYAVGIKAAGEKTVMKMANAAIESR
jgi:hypothetical protein